MASERSSQKTQRDYEHEAMEFLRENPWSSMREIRRGLDWDKSRYKILRVLENLGRVERRRQKSSGPYEFRVIDDE